MQKKYTMNQLIRLPLSTWTLWVMACLILKGPNPEDIESDEVE